MRSTWVVLALFAASTGSFAGPARVLKDINRHPSFDASSHPGGFVDLGGFAVFSARTHAEGRELWRTDGTAEGTRIVKDIIPGDPSAIWTTSPEFPAERVGDIAFFVADSFFRGNELWRTDGTEAGTRLVKDIRPGGSSALGESAHLGNFPRAAVGGDLYFLANDGTHGVELWRSDGTEAGTFLLYDFFPGLGSPFGSGDGPYTLEAVGLGERLVFRVRNTSGEGELWASDGTQEGTVRLAPVDVLGGSLDGVAYFVANDFYFGREIWRTDGTEEGTYLLRDVYPGVGNGVVARPVSAGGKIYFPASDGVHGTELWMTDGTFDGTTLVRDIGPAGVGSAPAIVSSLGGRVVFKANDGVHGGELWITDGTEAGTTLIRDIVAGTLNEISATAATPVGNLLYFVADDRVHGPGLWKTDGTEGGTSIVAGGPPGLLTEIQGRLFFVTSREPYGDEPWITDGTAAGTVLLRDIFAGRDSSNLRNVGRFAGKLYFSAEDDVHGDELWTTDGTSAGTRLAKDVNPFAQTEHSQTLFPTALGRRVVFVANDGTHGPRPWISDGTEEGTRIIADIQTLSSTGTNFHPLLAWKDRVWFPAFEGDHGWELWSTDGTETGTRLLRDVQPPAGVFFPPVPLIGLDDLLLFTADDGAHGMELWATDGTETGTRLVKDIRTGSERSSPSGAVRMGDSAYFLATDDDGYALYTSDGTGAGTVRLVGGDWLSAPVVFQDALWIAVHDNTTGGQLWRSDGTAEGTVQVTDGPGFWTDALFPAGGRLYFTAVDIDYMDPEPWISDGTAEGTHRLKDLVPGPDGSGAYYFTETRGGVVFAAWEPTVVGPALWRTDGTEEGTFRLLEDLGDPEFFCLVGDTLLFDAYDSSSGNELWRTDGTIAGTAQVQDLLPGPTSSYPYAITTFGSRTFFVARDELAGSEPWVARAGILTRQPARALADLGDDVRALELPQGVQQSLLAKLSAVENGMGKPKGLRVALKQLDNFVREVESKSPTPISTEAAADLIEFAGEIEQLLNETATPIADVPRPTIGERSQSLDLPRWR